CFRAARRGFDRRRPTGVCLALLSRGPIFVHRLVVPRKETPPCGLMPLSALGEYSYWASLGSSMPGAGSSARDGSASKGAGQSPDRTDRPLLVPTGPSFPASP